MNTTVRFLLLLFFLATGTITAQKKKLTPDDYKDWHLLAPGALTDNGQWCYYTLHYDSADTLFVKSLDNKQEYSVPGSLHGKFSADSHWFASLVGDSLTILELDSGKRRRIPRVEEFLLTGNNILTTMETRGSFKALNIMNPQGAAIASFDSVMKYKASGNGALAIAQYRNGKRVLTVSDTSCRQYKTITLAEAGGTIKTLLWSTDGTAVLLYSTGVGASIDRIEYVKVDDTGEDGFVTALLDTKSLPAAARLSDDYLTLGADGASVLFNVIEESHPEALPGGVQVWHAKAPAATPEPEGHGRAYCWVWHPASGEVRPLENDSLTGFVLSGDARHALLFNRKKYRPHYQYGGEVMDVYLADVQTGTTKKILERQPNENDYTLLSPEGKYILYYRDGGWWVYDIQMGNHRCITKNVKADWQDREYDYSGFPVPCGIAGWGNNDSEIFLYDNFDLWRVKPDGSNAVRITSGKPEGIRYRVCHTTPRVSRSRSPQFESHVLDPSGGLLLHALDTGTGSQSLLFWKDAQGLAVLDSGDKKIYNVSKASGGNYYLFLESSFATPPALRFAAPGKQATTVVQSNPRQSQFSWGYSRLIHYRSGGRSLNGVLCYPAGYDPAKRYPMIVNIYQRQSPLLHEYQPPTLYEPNGFNASIYTSEGYFVLYPDIAFRVNDPMGSALRDVTAAVKEAVRNHAIDPDTIGLLGHSFGGAETTYIVGHSKLFRTAVAGAPVTDFTSSYLGYDGYGSSNMWRFENQQFRITAPFYTAAFVNNSPLAAAQNITTPLLLWSGTRDMTVDVGHSKKLIRPYGV